MGKEKREGGAREGEERLGDASQSQGDGKRQRKRRGDGHYPGDDGLGLTEVAATSMAPVNVALSNDRGMEQIETPSTTTGSHIVTARQRRGGGQN